MIDDFKRRLSIEINSTNIEEFKCGYSLYYDKSISRQDSSFDDNIIEEADVIPKSANLDTIQLKEVAAEGYYNGKVSIKLIKRNGSLFLETYKRNESNYVHIKIVDINEHNLNHSNKYSLRYLLGLSSPLYNYEKSYNTDVIYAIGQYFDFLKTQNIVFNMSNVVALVGVKNLDNAYWNGQYLTFGDGCNSDNLLSPRGITKPLTSSCIVAHEMSHALIQYINDLEYNGHSGALNESYCDIIGVCFEEYLLTKFMIGYEIGSECYNNSALRSMSNPNKYRQPENINDQYYCNPSSWFDNGGVHINSGIINHIFYEFANILGKKESLKIFLDILFKLENNCNFNTFKYILINYLENHDHSSELIDIVYKHL